MGLRRFFQASIYRRVLGSLSVIFGFIVLSGVANFYQMERLRTYSEAVFPASMNLVSLQDFATALSSLDGDIERFLIVGGFQEEELVQTQLETMQAAVESLDTGIDNELAANVEQLRQQTDALVLSVTSLMEMDRSRDNARAVNTATLDVFDQLDLTAQEQIVESTAILAYTQDLITSQNTVVDQLAFQQLVLVGMALLASLVAGWLVARSISRPLAKMAGTASRITDGDLEARVAVKSNDEVGQMAMAFNQMAEKLQDVVTVERESKVYLEESFARYQGFISRVAEGDLTVQLNLGEADHNGDADDLLELGRNLNHMVANLRVMTTQVRNVSSAVAGAVTEIQATASEQLATANKQDAAINKTMTTVEDVRQTVSKTAARADQVTVSSRQSMDVSRQGQEVVRDTINGMSVVRDRVADIAETILALSERTQQIGEIIDTVNALADQSKLLALNASIEAARAGEEGKGFAVVALEVRQLAEQSRNATERVHGILSEIQQATNTAVMVTEEGNKGAAEGMSLAQTAGETIRELGAVLEEAMNAATYIAASTQQQTNSMEQLTDAMQIIRNSSIQAATSAEQTEQSVRNIVEMAHSLESAASRYQI